MDEVRCGQQWLQAKAGGREEAQGRVGGVLSVLAMSLRERGGEMELGVGCRVGFIKSDQQSFWVTLQQQALCPRGWRHVHTHTHTQMDGWTDR